MALQDLITTQQFEAVEMLGKDHFIEALMNALMAQPANPDARVKCALVHVPAEIRTAMNFARDQVMKSQINLSITQATAFGYLRFLSHKACYATLKATGQ